ncbi:hypothetical protein SR42_12460 [Clostridium botulinum]|uniref:hypothetical protein n=1 Tax=Clostridium botulinum TaxID=1491 RepID=UPI000597ABAC|nr:hypothetical protein [Clostridium botulinum]KIL07016.1 hypothetical protein SR42_12460 [Clostridium botulinum]
MAFSFGGLISAVVGAVAKVANAVVNALSPVAKSGGIVGGIAGAAVGVAEAVLGATAEFADVCEDGEIDDEEAEELLEDVFKLLVGAFIFPFDSGSSSAEIDSNENTCKNEPTLWSKTCNLGAGVLDGAKGTLDGLANMVKHPIDTINSARSFAENPEYAARVGKAIWKEIKDEYKRDVIDGDANSESYFTGRVLFEGALLFGPTVTKLNKSEKIGKASEAISEAEKVSKESEVISEVEKITEVVDNPTGTVWDNITGTADNMAVTEIPATFQIKLDDSISYANPKTGSNVLWTNANATEHMGEYVSRFGEESWSIDVRSQAMLESYSASLNDAMEKLATQPPGRYFEKYGNWELGINTETGVVYHAKMLY